MTGRVANEGGGLTAGPRGSRAVSDERKRKKLTGDVDKPSGRVKMVGSIRGWMLDDGAGVKDQAKEIKG